MCVPRPPGFRVEWTACRDEFRRGDGVHAVLRMGEAMAADLVPHAAIPELAARVTPGMLRALRHIQKADFIMNKGLDVETAESLRQLTELGLVDAGYEDD